jgi:purine-binding chemotaxis protein CheW
MEIVKDKSQDVSELLQLVSFRIDNEEFGIDILNVKEIIRIVNITKVPNSPDFVEGIINLRGKVIPVIDLRTKLGMPKKECDKDTRIVVVVIDERTVGFLVDAVSEVLRIPVNITEAPPEITAGKNSEYIKAVGKLDDRLLTLLDLNKILLKEEKQIMETIN